MNNQELVRLLAENLERHFVTVVECYTKRLHGYCYRFVEAEAGDMVQQTMLKAFSALKGYSQERILALDLEAWLFTIARNECFNELKRKKRGYIVGALDDQSDSQPSVPAIDPWWLIETQMELSEAILALSPIYKEVISLHYLEDWKIEEIAATLGVSEGTIKSRLSRARTLLRDILEKETDEGDRNDA